MKHLGDICNINGAEIEPVDVLIFGSPCQDFSVAGKGAGLNGTKSILIKEAIRIIKEMRESTNGRYPTFVVWENVPGALSSNNGKDFHTVLQELAKTCDPNAVIPEPKRRWTNAGTIVGRGWSISWRVQDAEFWGVPQRRRRIALVVDFRGNRAPEVLFERKGVQGDFETGEWAWCAATCRFIQRAEISSGEHRTSDEVGERNVAKTLRIRSGCDGGGKGALLQEDLSGTLTGANDQTLFYTQKRFGEYEKGIGTITAQGGHQNTSETIIVMATQQGHAEIRSDDKAPTITAAAGTSGNNQPVICLKENVNNICAGFIAGQGEKAGGIGFENEISPTLRAGQGLSQTPRIIYTKKGKPRKADDAQPYVEIETAGTLNCFDSGETRVNEVICFETYQKTAGTLMANTHPGSYTGQDAANDMLVAGEVKAIDCKHNKIQDISNTLQAGDTLYSINPIMQFFYRILYLVRRLTPKECERIQGYPDDWTDIGPWYDSKGKLHKESSDSARYQSEGNSIALPQWFWNLSRISKYLPENATLGSLFDGIGGFPLIWETIHGKNTARWASEIAEFPMAVTKVRFGNE